MKHSRLAEIILASVLALVALPVAVQAQAPEYSVTILGPPSGLSGISEIYCTGVNASGQVAGSIWTTGGTEYAVLWTGTTPTILGSLGGSQGSGTGGINTAGSVVGTSYSPGNTVGNAVVWNSTSPTVLSSFGGTTSQANAINDNSVVAGYSYTASNAATYAAVWNGTTPTMLGSLGGDQSSAFAINFSGVVAGYSTTSGDAVNDAVEWNGTSPTVLSSLGGTISVAQGINNAGTAVGASDTAGNATSHAVSWNGTTPTDLGVLAGTTTSNALSINNFGVIDGMSYTTDLSVQDPFLYLSGTMYSLEGLLDPAAGVSDLYISTGDTINDSGQIAATGVVDGQTEALLLTPTPEPGGAALLALGAGGLLGWRRRRL